MSLFSLNMKHRQLPVDLPLSDITPLEEYLGTSTFWKIYRSKLISSKSDVSVFVFDKSSIHKLKEKKTILKSVWKHVEIIQNIQKYSSVTLKIILTAKENRKYIAYATEPVIGSLANVLGDFPNDISKTQTSLLNKMNLCEIQIKYGVVSIAETLSYLHLYEGMIHCDICPRNVIVCANGAWRLSGYHFVMRAESSYVLDLNTAPDAVTSKYLQPDINFCGPGMFGGAPTQQSDVFSLGMLITAVYNDSTSLIEGTGIVSELISAKRSGTSNHHHFDQRMTSAYNGIKERIPAGLRHGLSKIISFDAEVRPTAQQLLMLGYYEDPLIKYLKKINLYENLPEREREVVLSTELLRCAERLPQAMIMSHIVPVLKYELEIDNCSPGVLTSLLTCLSRTPLTNKNTLTLCVLVNKAVESIMCSSKQAFSTKSHRILMEHILTLYKKSLSINELSSPVDVLISGFRHKEKLSDSLSAISKLVEDKESCNILNQQNLLNEVKLSFECHIKQENKDSCTAILDSMMHWLGVAETESLTSDVTKWLVSLLADDLDLLPNVADFLRKMLQNLDKYKLSTDVMEDVSSIVERLCTSPDITTSQRQVLIQLARCLEWTVNPPPPSLDTPKTVVMPNMSSDNTRSLQPQDPQVPGSGVSATSTSGTKGTFTYANRQGSQTSNNSSHCSSIPDIKVETLTPVYQPPFCLISDKKSGDGNIHSDRRVSRSRSSSRGECAQMVGAAAQQKKLLPNMGLSPAHNNQRRSIGDLMADIEDEEGRIGQLPRRRSPLLTRDNRASSLNVEPSRDDVGQGRRSSLQPDHYSYLAHTTIVPANTPQMVDEENQPIAKADSGSLMKSILSRLDSLASHFNSKGVPVSYPEDR